MIKTVAHPGELNRERKLKNRNTIDEKHPSHCKPLKYLNRSKTSSAHSADFSNRRHTWTYGLQHSFEEQEEGDFNTISDSGFFSSSGVLSDELHTRRDATNYNRERRRSSGSSIQEELIEECPSEEDEENVNIQSIDYMSCRNCSNASTEDIQEDIDTINYCFNCKHLHQKKKTLYGMTSAFNEGRRSSWNAGDKRETFFKRLSTSRLSSGRESVSGSIDLPSITEPDDETEDTNIVDGPRITNTTEDDKLPAFTSRGENDKLSTFTQKGEMHEDLKKLRYLNIRSHSLDMNEMKPLHRLSRGQTLQEFHYKGTVSVQAMSKEVYYPF